MNIIEEQQNYYLTGITRDFQFRIKLLKSLKKAIKNHLEEILFALKSDLNKSKTEAFFSEIYPVIEELNLFIKNLKNWEKPIQVKTSPLQFYTESYILNEPYGVALIISPWNYPFQLPLMCLIGAIAAGNCVTLKLSEYADSTSKIVAQIISEVFEEKHVSCFLGDAEVTKNLLNQKFDYIFYTGNSEIAKHVMHKASENLTPVTLELGGKSPCIVDKTANLEVSAQRIVWGKFLNAGQTCVAPDYLLVDKTIKSELIEKLKKYITRFYLDEPLKNSNYPKIINERHFIRLNNLLNSSNCIFGGQTDAQNLKIEPSLVNATFDDEIMKEEIFGPLLPILEYSNLIETIKKLQTLPKSLATYCFTEDKNIEKQALQELSFGGGCINDTIFHLTNPELPFGGIGLSGIGAYHGKSSYDTFTHKKSIMKKSTRLFFPIHTLMHSKIFKLNEFLLNVFFK